MSISASLHAICDLLKRETGLAAQAGLPSGAGKGFFVWPYRLVLAEARSAPPHPVGIPPEALPVLLDIPLLVLARPAFSEPGLDALDAAMLALMRHPIISFPTGQVQITFDSRLGMADFAALFANARVQPSLALELVARTTIKRADTGT